MEFRKFKNYYVVRLEKGEEITSSLKVLCQKEQITLGSISGLGAACEIEIGLFDTETKKYETTMKRGMYEITSLIGNISTMNNEIYLHNHINFSDPNNQVYGGHMVRCIISATCEIIITAIEGNIDRKFNETIGLNLWEFKKED